MAAGGASVVWTIPPSTLSRNLDGWVDRMLGAAFALAQVFAARIATWAQTNASWTDRTGNARQGLTGRAFNSASGFVIVLFHVMSYGIWLEVANAGRFAIIMKTLQNFHGPLMAALQRLVR